MSCKLRCPSFLRARLVAIQPSWWTLDFTVFLTWASSRKRIQFSNSQGLQRSTKINNQYHQYQGSSPPKSLNLILPIPTACTIPQEIAGAWINIFWCLWPPALSTLFLQAKCCLTIPPQAFEGDQDSIFDDFEAWTWDVLCTLRLKLMMAVIQMELWQCSRPIQLPFF